MAYKIAIASSDGISIDETFGSAKFFRIYEVENGVYKEVEQRSISGTDNELQAEALAEASASVEVTGCGPNSCNPEQSGCTPSSGGCHGGGCSGSSKKVELISDCRSIVCKKIGFNIQKQLEKKAISSFDVACTVEEALKKITFYFNRVDNHQSLRRQS